MEGGGLSEQRGCLSPAQRKGLWAMRGLRRVAELTFKAMRVMNKGSWTSGQEEEVRMSGFPPQSREKGVFCFLLQFPLFTQRQEDIRALNHYSLPLLGNAFYPNVLPTYRYWCSE